MSVAIAVQRRLRNNLKLPLRSNQARIEIKFNGWIGKARRQISSAENLRTGCRQPGNMAGDDVIVQCELGRFIDREECLAARQLEADQERDERDDHRDAGPEQVEEIDRGNLGRRIWRDERPNNAESRA